MRRLILIAALLVAGFVWLHSTSATQAGAYATGSTQAAVTSVVSPMCGALPFGC